MGHPPRQASVFLWERPIRDLHIWTKLQHCTLQQVNPAQRTQLCHHKLCDIRLQKVLPNLNLTWDCACQPCTRLKIGQNCRWPVLLSLSPKENCSKKIQLSLVCCYFNIYVHLTLLRDRWSGDLASHLHLSSPDRSEEELEDREEDVENEEDSEEHGDQSMERWGNPSVTEPVYSQLRKPPKVRFSQKSQLLKH